MPTNRFINGVAAQEFLDSIEDSIIKDVISKAYEKIIFSNSFPVGEFDLLYFYKILADLFRDRDTILQALTGEYREDKSGLGE